MKVNKLLKQLFIIILLIVSGYLLLFLPTEIKLYEKQKQNETIKSKMINGVFQIEYINEEKLGTYKITKDITEYKSLTDDKIDKLDYNKNDYLILEIYRGGSCDADISITKVAEYERKIKVYVQLYNYAEGCARSSPRYFAIPIKKGTDSNIDIDVLDEETNEDIRFGYKAD